MHDNAPNRSRWPVALSVVLVGFVVAIAIAAALASILLPAGDRIGWEGVAAGVIFVASYLALAIGRIPGLSIDRAGIALVGAGLMVASGALPLEDAYKAVDFDTITLLLGVMIVVASLLADVRGALGPFLNVFLVTQWHWSQTQVGLVTTLGARARLDFRG